MVPAMMTKILMSIVTTTMLFQLALSVDHNVGAPNGGWDTSTDLQAWASAQSFLVGDNLVFTYGGSHDVLEVTKDAYDSCSTSSPVTTNRASPTTFALTKSGIRYFICGTAGHCAQGMKVGIATIEPFPFPPPGSALPPVSKDGPRSGYDPDDYDDAPAPPGAKQSPKPGSAATVKIMTIVSMMGFGFLLMI